MFKNRGFTLAELMIVIGVIGILAASLYPSFASYLARGRDTAKIAEISQLHTAIILYKVDKGTYLVPGTGEFGLGQGWVNILENGASITLARALQNLGYMSNTIKHMVANSIPPISYNIAPCVVNGAISRDVYMIYFTDVTDQYSISGYLENPKQSNIDNIILSYNSTGSNGTCTQYGMNYAVGQN